MKIHEIHIRDFKFFSDIEAESPLLKINGKHLLIYGENGSGKSTIYWALYTLLESSLKKSDNEIRKYFKKIGNESLVNIFSSGKNNSEIKVVLKDGTNSTYYRVSRKRRDLSIRGNPKVQESSMASDFINYRVLFQLHSLKHSKDNDLWTWFAEEILPHVKIGNDPCLNTFEKIKNGPEKVKNIHGEDVYPTANLRKSKIEQEAKDYQKYIDYKKELNNWNNWLISFLNDINIRANDLIKGEFKYNFKIQLTFKPKAFELSATEFKFYPPKIIISIPEYHGIRNPNIKKPHTFLNEAKWSAIGLSIRFAVLDIKLYSAELKSLVIDDLLISLDMSNRDVVSKLILNKYSQDYQLILMTHDRSYFNWLNFELENRGLLSENGPWKILEMYVNEADQNIPLSHDKPLILVSKSELSIAKNHFSNHDYASAANYLRKYSENVLCSWLPEQYWKDKESKDNSNSKMPLRNIIDNGIKFLERINQNNGLYKELRKYVRILLNPLSHSDVGVNRYKVEVQNIFNILSEINSFHQRTTFRTIISGGEEFEIRIQKNSTNQIYVYSFETVESLYSYQENSHLKLSKCLVNSKYCYPIESNGTVIYSNKSRFENYQNKDLYETYSNICNFESEFIAQSDLRPFLFDKNGKNI